MDESKFKQVMVSDETHARLRARADRMRQSMAAHIAYLLDLEDASLLSVPNPGMTIEQAQLIATMAAKTASGQE